VRDANAEIAKVRGRIAIGGGHDVRLTPFLSAARSRSEQCWTPAEIPDTKPLTVTTPALFG
jgi:hypothetical protein